MIETGVDVDFYIGFNRATGVNADNDLADNQVTLIQQGGNGKRLGHYSPSNLIKHMAGGGTHLPELDGDGPGPNNHRAWYQPHGKPRVRNRGDSTIDVRTITVPFSVGVTDRIDVPILRSMVPGSGTGREVRGDRERDDRCGVPSGMGVEPE